MLDEIWANLLNLTVYLIYLALQYILLWETFVSKLQQVMPLQLKKLLVDLYSKI